MDIGGTSGTDTETATNPAGHAHDALFRVVLGHPEHAAAELRSVLPTALSAHLDLSRLTPVPGSFIDPHLRRHHTDVLFRTTTGDGTCVYVLIEHQRTPDPLMALRILTYQTQIWRRHLTETTDPAQIIEPAGPGRPARPLPPIIPLVVYQGNRRWNAATDLAGLLDTGPGLATALGDLLPHLTYTLDDLTTVSETALRRRPLTPAARLALLSLGKAPGSTDVTTWTIHWLDDFRAIESDVELFAALMNYYRNVGTTPEPRLQRFAALVGPHAEEITVTTAEQLQAQGEARGKAIGEARGKAIGKATGRAELLLHLLTIRFGALDDATRERVENATSAQITAWSTRLLDPDATLADILA